MDPTLWLMLAFLPVLIVASGFFSGSETALFSLSRHQRLVLERRKGASAAAIGVLLSETRGLLITLLLGNMTVNVLFFAVSSAATIRISERPWADAWVLSVLSLLPLLIIILLGEVLPKLVASRSRVTWSGYASIPLLMVHRALTPVRMVAQHGVITPLARLIAPRTRVAGLSTDELESLLRLSEDHGILDTEEERLLLQVLELGQLRVEDLMIPRVDIKAFDVREDPQALMTLIRDTGLRHIPVKDDSLDTIVGLLYSRQVLVAQPTTHEAVNRLIRQVHYVPAVTTADKALVELRRSGTTFAIVVDEYGGTAGLITLEDIVEHMVGDIAGEFEASGRPEVRMIGLGRWRVDGDLAVHDWPDLFGRELNLGAEALEALDSTTLGGLVMDQLGRLPEEGDELVVGNVRLRVERMARNRVVTVVVSMVRRGEGGTR
ncbi:hemolysin family protein [Mucisphaera calidilacus]|uniref:Magnesium and cobalt efflux protein CorC n=1 Tax=Mucisphaera calidilacus TaxID=2527982 RepID=A0A518BVC7_9BACT|nr:hemolysin family protein [Mucisphaera calidilacus]QDU70926.1 Magnesium and cobalt efflux protein CorC [Mucisphaera calidilacus]